MWVLLNGDRGPFVFDIRGKVVQHEVETACVTFSMPPGTWRAELSDDGVARSLYDSIVAAIVDNQNFVDLAEFQLTKFEYEQWPLDVFVTNGDEEE